MNLNFLKKLLSQPTAPYREALVQKCLIAELKRQKVPFFLDPHRNIVVGVKSKEQYLARLRKKTKEPLRLFIAHTDHPGFHVTKAVKGLEYEFKWYGGSAKKQLVGAKVWLCNQYGELVSGRTTKVRLTKHGFIDSGRVKMDRHFDVKTVPKEVYGGFQFRAPVWQEGRVLYTKAADDLVGSFAILTLAKKLKGNPNFIGILTRAEEVGFIGCIYHFELGWLKAARRKIVCVSLETSRTLPGAEVGKGPIVRLGDRATCFDPSAVEVLHAIARKHSKKYQRRIMDGGTCEGTVCTAYGYPTLAMSIPLGNYHNQSFQGGPDSRGKDGPAPEFVHLDDLQGMLMLGERLCRTGLPWNAPWASKVKDFKRWKNSARRLMALN